MEVSDKSDRGLGYIYDLLYDIKTTEQLQQEVDYLAHRLAGLAKLCRGDRRPIDNYLKEVLSLKEERHE